MKSASISFLDFHSTVTNCVSFTLTIIVTFLFLLFHYYRYNIGHVGISLGDLGLAYQAFKVAVSVDPTHGEALNNIAVLEMRRQKFEVAKSCLSTSCEVAPHIFEPLYNSGM